MKKHVMWDGHVWTLYSSGYYTRKDLKHLHRAKWEKLRGPIPPNHHIHHRDHDKTNNRMSNLVCISASEHARQHKIGFVVTPAHQAKMQAARFANVEAYEAKRLATLAAKPDILVTCAWCKKEFGARRKTRRTCSQYCRDQRTYWGTA